MTSIMAHKKLRTVLLVAIFVGIWFPASAGAGDLKIAAAADLTFAFKDVGAQFVKQTGDSLELQLRFVGKFFRADSKWRAVRSVFFC